MSHWKQTTVNFGSVKQDKVLDLEFEALHTIPVIVSLDASCGCTTPKYDPFTRKLSVKFKAGKIPNQVTGNQPVEKYIYVKYQDGSLETLSIKGTKIR
jgi:hypothetical protein